MYRQPLIKGELPRPRNDVEVPPAVSSLGYLLEEEELYKGWVKFICFLENCFLELAFVYLLVRKTSNEVKFQPFEEKARKK